MDSATDAQNDGGEQPMTNNIISYKYIDWQNELFYCPANCAIFNVSINSTKKEGIIVIKSENQKMMDILSKKNQRVRLHQEVASLTDDYIAESNAHLFSRVKLLEEYSAACNIMIYYSVKREPDTIRIAEDALAVGKTVAFPYCYRGGIMRLALYPVSASLRNRCLGFPLRLILHRLLLRRSSTSLSSQRLRMTLMVIALVTEADITTDSCLKLMRLPLDWQENVL